DFINSNMSMLDKNSTYYIHCAGGYRSMITASILKARGYENLINIRGGFAALATTSLPKTNYEAPKTML
ncbi:rhodanese-like domain-containing protein, partial [Flavihumibacter sediminis]|nr:rhodanese-like domain-containing protein [Flavihumibacter sediminis]